MALWFIVRVYVFNVSLFMFEDIDDCEEWERHEALHDEPRKGERNKERLFEEKIELKWEKGGSGLVFYTDAQYWKKQEGGKDSKYEYWKKQEAGKDSKYEYWKKQVGGKDSKYEYWKKQEGGKDRNYEYCKKQEGGKDSKYE